MSTVADGRVALRVEDLTVQFGGLIAVDAVQLEAPLGRLTGLIGPNGAGKTTMFNACSGMVRASDGRIVLLDEDVTSSSEAARAQRGLGRTFQRMELFDSLTVRDNVAIGREAGLAGSNPWRQVVARRGEAAEVAESVEDALALCDLLEVADRRAGQLSTGQRRLTELARVLSGRFTVLLLDEPSSGLDRAETERFGEILRRVVEERGIGILLVEHDMDLVMSVCDYVYVLDFGKLLFKGTPAEVRADTTVRAAYLGEAV